MVIGGTFTRVSATNRAYLATFSKTTVLSAINFDVNGPVYALHPGPTATTVYVGGDFTSINGVARTDIALVDVSTGQVVTSWAPPSNNFGFVNSIAAVGSRVYLGGTFTQVGGVNRAGLAALRASNGTVDPFLTVQLTGHHNDSGSGAQGWVGAVAIDVTADGREMVAVGNFKYANGLLRDQVVQIDLSGSSAVV